MNNLKYNFIEVIDRNFYILDIDFTTEESILSSINNLTNLENAIVKINVLNSIYFSQQKYETCIKLLKQAGVFFIVSCEFKTKTIFKRRSSETIDNSLSLLQRLARFLEKHFANQAKDAFQLAKTLDFFNENTT